MLKSRTIIAVAAWILAACPAAAQTKPTPPVNPDCPPPKPGEPLSKQLDQSKGVICPPATGDTGITKPPPESGAKTPVIPPPGSPGGDQKTQPK